MFKIPKSIEPLIGLVVFVVFLMGLGFGIVFIFYRLESPAERHLEAIILSETPVSQDASLMELCLAIEELKGQPGACEGILTMGRDYRAIFGELIELVEHEEPTRTTPGS